jgi:hypothetical protein
MNSGEAGLTKRTVRDVGRTGISEGYPEGKAWTSSLTGGPVWSKPIYRAADAETLAKKIRRTTTRVRQILDSKCQSLEKMVEMVHSDT